MTDLSQIVERVPRVIIVLALAGTIAAAGYGGLPWSIAFLVGAAGAYFNFRLIERLVKTLVQVMIGKNLKRPKLHGFRLFAQLALFFAGLFVILRFYQFNLTAALLGFLVCPAAVLLESIYYLLITYGHHS
ncbi:MAG TPA: hypothetical protein VG297_21160 [Bryobacteraceae bacterium]|nr:hypothetical protein [Bryobacteraceae bacterium]